MMKKRAVSAIIGVILMVTITIVIAVVVFIHVENIHDEEQSEVFVEGWVIDAFNKNTNISINGHNYSIWQVSLGLKYNTPLEYTSTYEVAFTHNMSPPPEGVHLRLYYHTIVDNGTVFEVYKVKSL